MIWFNFKLCRVVKSLKVSTFIYCHLQGNPDQQRFTIQSGVLTDNDTRWRSASSGSPLPEWTDFGPHSLQLQQTHLCLSQPHYGLHPAMFSSNDSLF